MYQCTDCLFKAKKTPSGYCPSCGSANLKRLSNSNTTTTHATWQKMRLFTLGGTWVAFVILLYQNLN
jgi:hypothetical protein